MKRLKSLKNYFIRTTRTLNSLMEYHIPNVPLYPTFSPKESEREYFVYNEGGDSKTHEKEVSHNRHQALKRVLDYDQKQQKTGGGTNKD